MKRHTVVDSVVYFLIGVLLTLLLNGCSHITYSNAGYSQNIPNYSVINSSNHNNSTMVITTTNPNKTYIYNYNDPNKFPRHSCNQYTNCNHN